MTLIGSSSAAPFKGPLGRSVATGDPLGETAFAAQFPRSLKIVKSGFAMQLRGPSADTGTATGALGAIPWKQNL